MKLVTPYRRYPSIDAFYDELPDVDRRLSKEVDFGMHWTEPAETRWTWPRSRLTWVEHTGELIVVRLGRVVRQRTPVKVIAVIESREELERVLSGWEQHCGNEGLGWVYMRLTQANANEECHR